jgi:hypothetical protein
MPASCPPGQPSAATVRFALRIPNAPTIPPPATRHGADHDRVWNACTDSAFGANVSPDERARDDDADRRDADEPGDPRDRVVDRRGDPGVALVGVASTVAVSGATCTESRSRRHERAAEVGQYERLDPERRSSRIPPRRSAGPRS